MIIAGHAWRPLSPSHFEQIGYPVQIAFDGRSWLIAVRGAWGIREFASRDEAAQLIADAFTAAHKENLA